MHKSRIQESQYSNISCNNNTAIKVVPPLFGRGLIRLSRLFEDNFIPLGFPLTNSFFICSKLQLCEIRFSYLTFSKNPNSVTVEPLIVATLGDPA